MVLLVLRFKGLLHRMCDFCYIKIRNFAISFSDLIRHLLTSFGGGTIPFLLFYSIAPKTGASRAKRRLPFLSVTVVWNI